MFEEHSTPGQRCMHCSMQCFIAIIFPPTNITHSALSHIATSNAHKNTWCRQTRLVTHVAYTHALISTYLPIYLPNYQSINLSSYPSSPVKFSSTTNTSYASLVLCSMSSVAYPCFLRIASKVRNPSRCCELQISFKTISKWIQASHDKFSLGNNVFNTVTVI